MVVAYSIFIVLHIVGVAIAIGSATIVDYLHLVGLRRSYIEKSMAGIYPYMSRMINMALIIIYFSGISLVLLNPDLISNPLFLTKIALVIVVTINGLYLQRSVAPHLEKCVLNGTKYCTSSVLYSSAIAGSVSIVTWYSILILSLTKSIGYTPVQFLTGYFVVLALAIIIAYTIERKARKWRE